MAFTDALDVDIGDPTKASDYDTLADNTEFNRETSDIDHDFDISTGDGHHKKTIHFGTDLTWQSVSNTTLACAWWVDSSGSLWLLGKNDETGTFNRADADFYFQLGDIADVPAS